jgi:hypothetical protein
MVNANYQVTKVCSFCASDWHFITMLLPHLNKSINEGKKIATILEEDSQNKVAMLLEKLRLKNAKKILDINWNKKEENEYEIEKILRKRGEKELEIIINGTENFINNVNELIEDYRDNNTIIRKIRIINCYYVTENLNMREILSKHDMVLNTAGEEKVEKFMAKVEM